MRDLKTTYLTFEIRIAVLVLPLNKVCEGIKLSRTHIFLFREMFVGIINSE